MLEVETPSLTAIARGRRNDGMNEITFQLSTSDTTQFAEMTHALQGQTLTLSACGTILAAPTILMPIEDGLVLITGGTDAGISALFDALENGAPCPKPAP